MKEDTSRAASNVKVETQHARVRIDEAGRKTGLTFGDLRNLVKAGDDAGIPDDAIVWGETWNWSNAPQYQPGRKVRFLRA